MSSQRYTQAQKLNYYRNLARQKQVVRGRGAYRYVGRGDYTEVKTASKKARAPRKTENSINKRWRRVGESLGGGLGELGAEVYKFFTGRGSYQVVNNSLMASDPSRPPIINRVDKPGAVIIRKSEYIGDVISSSSANTFSNTSYSVNPGLSTVFHWLAQLAVNFEEYEFIGMYFEFRSMSADALNSTNTALGQVILAMDYNAGNSAFSSKQQMEDYEASISVKPSQPVRFFVECSKKLNVLSELYVRGGAVPSNQDVRMYDLGNFQIATNGLQGTSVNLGELWVCYEVALMKTKLYTTLGFGIPWYGGVITGYSAGSPLNTVTAWTGTTLGITTTATSITFPLNNAVIYYSVYIEWLGSVAGAVVFPVLTATNCTIRSQTTPLATDMTRALCYNLLVSTTGVGTPSIALGTAGTFPTSVQNGTLFISQISSAIPVTSF